MLEQQQKIKDLNFLSDKISDGDWIVISSQLWFTNKYTAADHVVTDDEFTSFIGSLFEIFLIQAADQDVDIEDSVLGLFSNESIAKILSELESNKSEFPIHNTQINTSKVDALRHIENIVRFDEVDKQLNGDYGYFIFVSSKTKGNFLIANGDLEWIVSVIMLRDCLIQMLWRFKDPDEYESCLRHGSKIIRHLIN